jgi:hypothetical protein
MLPIKPIILRTHSALSLNFCAHNNAHYHYTHSTNRVALDEQVESIVGDEYVTVDHRLVCSVIALCMRTRAHTHR